MSVAEKRMTMQLLKLMKSSNVIGKSTSKNREMRAKK